LTTFCYEGSPRYVVGENVLGLTNWNGGIVFDEVHTDLELAGYEVAAVVVPAAAVNAPHGRDRVWFVARELANRTPTCDGFNSNVGTESSQGDSMNPDVRIHNQRQSKPGESYASVAMEINGQIAQLKICRIPKLPNSTRGLSRK
jgi:site-specific DNA-cytosine methylase